MSETVQQEFSRDIYAVTAQFYDQVYGWQSQRDLQFYLDLAQQHPGPVLELGCGTGRVLLELARAGCAVTGLDSSPAMLKRLHDKLEQEPAAVQQRVKLVEGDMVDFALGKYALILAPFRAFQHVLEPADQRRCLRCIAQHLLPDGRFVFDAFEPSLPYIVHKLDAGAVWVLDQEVAAANGGTIRRYAMVEPLLIRQVHRVRFKYEVYDAAERLVDSFAEVFDMRWQNRYEAQYLLELSGLQVERALGSYDGRPMDEQLGELIFICTRQ